MAVPSNRLPFFSTPFSVKVTRYVHVDGPFVLFLCNLYSAYIIKNVAAGRRVDTHSVIRIWCELLCAIAGWGMRVERTAIGMECGRK
jgi:hypothetical protein